MKKDITINMRARPADINLIDYAARVLGKTRSAFLRESAEHEAMKVLATPRLVYQPDQLKGKQE